MGTITQGNHGHRIAGSWSKAPVELGKFTNDSECIRDQDRAKFQTLKDAMPHSWKQVELAESTVPHRWRSRLNAAPAHTHVPAVGTRFFALQSRQSVTHSSPHEAAEIERKSNDPDKKRTIKIHPSWLVGEVILDVL